MKDSAQKCEVTLAASKLTVLLCPKNQVKSSFMKHPDNGSN